MRSGQASIYFMAHQLSSYTLELHVSDFILFFQIELFMVRWMDEFVMLVQ